MNISFITTARLFAFDALKIVTPKDALSDFAPIRFGCARQAHLASGMESWILNPAAMTPRILGRALTSDLDYRTGRKKGSAWPRRGLRRLGARAARPYSENSCYGRSRPVADAPPGSENRRGHVPAPVRETTSRIPTRSLLSHRKTRAGE